MRCTLVETPDHFPQSGHDLATFVQLFQGGKTLQRTFWTIYYHVWLLSCMIPTMSTWSSINNLSSLENPGIQTKTWSSKDKNCDNRIICQFTVLPTVRYGDLLLLLLLLDSKDSATHLRCGHDFLGASFRHILQYPLPAFACNMDRGVAQASCGMDSMPACTGIRLAIRLQAIHFQCSTSAKWLLTRRCPPHNKSQLQIPAILFALRRRLLMTTLFSQVVLSSICLRMSSSFLSCKTPHVWARQTGHMRMPCLVPWFPCWFNQETWINDDNSKNDKNPPKNTPKNIAPRISSY